MLYLSRRALLKSVDENKIVGAIRKAEEQTCGEIRVSLARFFWGDVRKVADKAFLRLGMNRTENRNAVLFFIVPGRRRFVILGDTGIHAALGQEFWDGLASILSESFRRRDFTGGLVRAIEEAGEKLAAHFPSHGAADVNELPDEVDFSFSRRSRRG